MFFILSKILFYLIMPLTWVLAFLIYGIVSKNRRRSRVALWLALGTLLLFSNSFLLNEAFLAWEKAPVPVKELKKHDAAILLTGFTSLEKSPHDRVYTNKGADRMLHTVMLYKIGYCRKIIISGGLGLMRKTYASEALEIKTLLLLAGVPETDIILESKSKNTYENAQFTKKLLSNYPDIKSVILVTSAFHMRRASGCFTKAGIPHTIFPADYYSSDRMVRLEDSIPAEQALAGWHRLVHEIAGYLVYSITGYL